MRKEGTLWYSCVFLLFVVLLLLSLLFCYGRARHDEKHRAFGLFFRGVCECLCVWYAGLWGKYFQVWSESESERERALGQRVLCCA